MYYFLSNLFLSGTSSHADLQNVRNFTRAGFFISRFYTRKWMNYINFKIATKQRNLSAITMYTAFTSTSGWVTLPGLGNITQAGNITQPRILSPVTTWESIIENIHAVCVNNSDQKFTWAKTNLPEQRSACSVHFAGLFTCS